MDVNEKFVKVHIIDVTEGPVRLRADSMRWTVALDVNDDVHHPSSVILPRNTAVLKALGKICVAVSDVMEKWENGERKAP